MFPLKGRCTLCQCWIRLTVISSDVFEDLFGKRKKEREREKKESPKKERTILVEIRRARDW